MLFVFESLQDLGNLKEIQLDGCNRLKKLPDLSKASKLESVYLSECKSLCDLHPSLLSLDTLVTLHVEWCTKLKSLKSEKNLRSLCYLRVKGCEGLKEFSLSSDSIVRLDLDRVRIEVLHLPIGCLRNLKQLWLDGSRLKELPDELSSLTSLEKLAIYSCKVAINKAKLQVIFDGLLSLTDLRLVDCDSLSELPDNIGMLSSLELLDLRNCRKLQYLPELPPSLSGLFLENCEKHQCVPELQPSLSSLFLENCEKLQYLPELPPSLESLFLENCEKLQCVPELPPSLRYLNLENCRKLQYLPELPPSLTDLNLENCEKLQYLPELPPSLRDLNLKNCRKLQYLPELPPSLEAMYISNCEKLQCVPELPPSIKKFCVDGCPSLVTVSASKPFAAVMKENDGYLDFSLKNCTKLDGDSLYIIMEGAHLAMMISAFQRASLLSVCCPGSRIPRQFPYRTTETESSINVELPSRHRFKGFFFSVVLSIPPHHTIKYGNIVIECYLADGTKRIRFYHSYGNFNSDHVLMWNDACKIPMSYEGPVSFGFCFLTTDDKGKPHYDSTVIKECGVRLI